MRLAGRPALDLARCAGAAPAVHCGTNQPMEPDMAFVTADVVENPGGELPFKVVFKQGETVLGEWPVETKAEGEEQILEMIREVIADDDDEDDGEEDGEDDDGNDKRKKHDD
jgi:hypothetical protein